jgi:hypothetical protein
VYAALALLSSGTLLAVASGSVRAQASSAFEAYPADTSPLPATRPPDFSGADTAVRRGRAFIEQAAKRGPDFAGRVVVARWGCGRACERWALVDLANGRIAWVEDAALQPVRHNFPCSAEPLEYRGNSRLLRVHRLAGDRVVTQDIVWWEDYLEKGVESVQTTEAFCRR